ncbi:MAG: methyltransferase domain-containing protein [Faecousia sp.]
MGKYDSSIDQWDNIFSAETPAFPRARLSGNTAFDKGLEWLTENTTSVLDFGCGNGIVLFLCALHGTATHIGIDLSAQAIRNAEAAARVAPCGEFHFECGSLEVLRRMESSSVDAVILSNIMDNLYPEDAAAVLTEVKRILRTNGKLLLKLNPYITAAQIESWGIRVIEGNLLDDGMLLWNQTTPEWDAFLGARFHIERFENIYYEEHAQYNRMYLLRKL